ncbi:tyrosine-type recombinase/integrase [Aliarcobacter cibarius]|uniref:Site-specific integrase n=1 Tax=Aliarcobacter cibarius TaxID=255507 RepID=A0A7L5JNJ0_9BACT|nr:site-specific integrase [Aliarcobacter cibarius]QKJ26793.1 site-specific tyrosine recombinase, phage integrase family (INT_ICEBs1_C_like domain) [Aliarcobacter cibarius]TLS98057.1 site-specific integrase [Aliarcobacter cibarius]TLS98977.1 site-specific integrase [Aliarcobacter cibarius]
MTFYNRNGILYARINGKRVSTKLVYSKENIKLYKSYAKNEEFFKKFDVKNDSTKTIADLCEEVLIEKEKKLQQTTIDSYWSNFKTHILPFIGNKCPHEITPKQIKEWYSSINTLGTLNICVNSILKPAFEIAIIEGYIRTSPFVVKFPTLRSNYEMNPFNLEEIKLLLDNAEGWFKNFLGIAFFTGLRTGEILALEWKDINLQNSLISITKTQTRGINKQPKTKNSIREIDILYQAEIFFRNQQKISGLGQNIFNATKRTGKLYGSCSLKYRWKELLKNCNLEYRNIYQTRHSFASNMLSNKEDIFWVSKMLGHKNPNITLERYSKYVKKDRNKKITFLDKENFIFAQN